MRKFPHCQVSKFEKTNKPILLMHCLSSNATTSSLVLGSVSDISNSEWSTLLNLLRYLTCIKFPLSRFSFSAKSLSCSWYVSLHRWIIVTYSLPAAVLPPVIRCHCGWWTRAERLLPAEILPTSYATMLWLLRFYIAKSLAVNPNTVLGKTYIA